MESSTTRRSKLSEVARHVKLPTGIVSTDYPRIERRCLSMGIRFEEWQRGLGSGALGLRSDGRYAATVGGIVWSIPRQVGKTFTVGALMFALAIEVPGLLILWTAHHTRTTGETFRSMQSMARRSKIKPHVAAVYTGSGTESVVFTNGSRILFGARDQGFGLGFAAVDVIIFDEAQRLNDTTRMDMVPAMNRASNPAGGLLFYIGTPPRPKDRGEAFAQLRAEALEGDEDTFFVEFSADSDADLDDRAQWKKANPSYPHFTPEESMLRMRKHLGTDEAWQREALGIWDAAGSSAVIPAQIWLDAGDDFSVPVDRFALGVEVAPDMARASVALAGQRDDGRWHVELDEAREGVDWLVPFVEGLLEANPQIRAVVADAGGPVAPLLDQRGPADWVFKGTRVSVYTPKAAELAAGCSTLLAGVVAGDIRHTRQGQVGAAVAGAGKRAYGTDTGLWVWSRKSAAVDITPVQAITLALIGAQVEQIRRRPLRRRKDASARRAVVL